MHAQLVGTASLCCEAVRADMFRFPAEPDQLWQDLSARVGDGEEGVKATDAQCGMSPDRSCRCDSLLPPFVVPRFFAARLTSVLALESRTMKTQPASCSNVSLASALPPGHPVAVCHSVVSCVSKHLAALLQCSYEQNRLGQAMRVYKSR